jgi:hypothetical protein
MTTTPTAPITQSKHTDRASQQTQKVIRDEQQIINGLADVIRILILYRCMSDAQTDKREA